MALGTGLSSWAGGGGVNRTQSNPYTSAPVPFKTPFQKDQDTYRSVVGTVGNQYAPQYAGYDAQMANAAGRYGAESGYNAAQQGFARGDYDLNMRGLGFDRRSLDLNRANLGIDAGGAQRDIGYYQNMLSQMPGYRDLSNQEYQNTLNKLRLAGQQERIGINSDATGRGAWFSPMRGTNIYASMVGQNQGEGSARISYEGDQLGLNEKQWGLDRGLGGAQDSQAKIANAQRQIDIDAQRLGVTADKYKADLEKGLAQLGYQNFMSFADLMEMKNSTDVNKAQLGQQIIEQAWGLMNSGLGSQYQQYFGG